MRTILRKENKKQTETEQVSFSHQPIPEVNNRHILWGRRAPDSTYLKSRDVQDQDGVCLFVKSSNRTKMPRAGLSKRCAIVRRDDKLKRVIRAAADAVPNEVPSLVNAQAAPRADGGPLAAGGACDLVHGHALCLDIFHI